MKSALEVYEKFLNAITKAVGVIAGILLLLPALMVFYEVVMRGLFNAPTEWSIELSVYCVLVAGFLGMSVTYAAGKHIHVDIVLSHLSARTRCYIELFTTIVGIFFCAVFVMQSLDMALLSYEMEILHQVLCELLCGFLRCRCRSVWGCCYYSLYVLCL